MAYANTLKIFEVLRPAFDEKQATKIAEAVETAFETNNAALFSKMATKGDLTELKAATKADLAEMKAEIIKWMFIFWIGQFASITAVLFLFFKR
ncbi:MAG: hypothetical protein J7M11_00915 [Elusimicrobia bacterium]|nr:hypothetical protein [Elusimicrobiota bacterium]